MVLGKLIAAAFGIATVAVVGIFIRDAAAQGLGPAIGSTGAGLGTLGGGISQVGTGIGTGISGVFKPFTDLLGFFGTLGSFFGTAPAVGGAASASNPSPFGTPFRPAANLTAARSAANRPNRTVAKLPSFASAVSPSSALGRAILSSQSRFPSAFRTARGL